MMRPGQWEPLIDEASQRFGVPQDIIMRVMGVESGGRRDAVSPKGAAGLMQLMAPTYTELARKHNLGPDRFDPTNNVMAGTAYLRENYDRFGGDWSKALAAYNAGPSRVESDGPLPAETQAYVPKVLAGFNQEKGTDVAPGLIRPQPGQTSGMGAMFGAVRPNQSLTGLLEVEDANNFYDGLGNLLNFGQTESQPPRIDPAAMPGTTQTDRLDVSGKINELIQQYLQKPQAAGPSQLQYALAGAQKGMAGLSGVHDRKVGIGEMLGALGGGVTSGGLAYDEAQQQRQGGDLAKLLQVGSYQNQNRTAELNEANSIIDNRLKDAQTQKALRAETDAKVVGKGVYVNGKWEAAPWANGSDSGPLDGTGIDAQMTNVYVTLSQKQASGQPLTPQETQMLALSERHLNKPRLVTGPDGVVREVAPEPLPQAGGPPAPQGTAPPTPTPSRVTEVVSANVKPTNEQNLNAAFANRLNAANSIFDTLEAKGYAVPSKYDTTVGQLPGVGNYMTSDQYKSLEQAQREFVTAQLRRESGAAISESEFEMARKLYFPQPGDPPEIVAQKRHSRELAVRNMAQSSGPAKIDFTPKKVDETPDPLGIR